MSALLRHLVRRVLAPEAAVRPPRHTWLVRPPAVRPLEPAPAPVPDPELAAEGSRRPVTAVRAVRGDEPSSIVVAEKPDQPLAGTPARKTRRPESALPAAMLEIEANRDDPPEPEPEPEPELARAVPPRSIRPSAGPVEKRVATELAAPEAAAPAPSAAVSIPPIRASLPGERQAPTVLAPPQATANVPPGPEPDRIASAPSSPAPPRPSRTGETSVAPAVPTPAPAELSRPRPAAAAGPVLVPGTAIPGSPPKSASRSLLRESISLEPLRAVRFYREVPLDRPEAPPATAVVPAASILPAASPPRPVPAETRATAPAATKTPGLLPRRLEAPRPAAMDRPARAPAPPDVHITIGRVEIRAVAAAPPPRQPAPSAPPAAVESLADYLARRDGARR